MRGHSQRLFFYAKPAFVQQWHPSEANAGLNIVVFLLVKLAGYMIESEQKMVFCFQMDRKAKFHFLVPDRSGIVVQNCADYPFS